MPGYAAISRRRSDDAQEPAVYCSLSVQIEYPVPISVLTLSLTATSYCFVQLEKQYSVSQRYMRREDIGSSS